MTDTLGTRQLLYVQDVNQLDVLCKALRGSPWVAVDTEFLREKTYFPKLCLLQVANDSIIACVDPLASFDLAPLFDILYDSSVIKILHSARQDYEIFFYLMGRLPRPIFDTQIAASICTGDEQISYAALVEQVTGVILGKGCTRTDWSKRPLTAEQLKYAQDDVRYLGAIYRHQSLVLRERGLSEWQASECVLLVEPETYQIEPDKMWLRIKESRRMRPAQLAVLQLLTAWREEQAVARDKPRKWIISDEILVELARKCPGSEAELHNVKGISDALISRHGQRILSLLTEAKQIPCAQWPEAPKRVKRTVEEEAMIDVMMALIRKCAVDHGVASSVLGGRKDIEALLSRDQNSRFLRGWRYDVIGEILQRFLNGEIKVAVVDDHLKIEAAG